MGTLIPKMALKTIFGINLLQAPAPQTEAIREKKAV